MPVLRSRRLVAVAVLIVLIVILVTFIDGWSDYMWFASHNSIGVFWTLLLTRYGVGIPIFLVAFFFFLLNFWYVRRNLPPLGLLGQDNQVIDLVQNPFRNLAASRVGFGLMLVLSAFLALMMAMQAGSQWQLVQRFFHATPFGQTDPVFGLDIGFYIFKLPFYELIQSLLAAVLWLALIFCGFTYFFLVSREFVQGGWRYYSPVKLHLALLVAGTAGAAGLGVPATRLPAAVQPASVLLGGGLHRSCRHAAGAEDHDRAGAGRCGGRVHRDHSRAAAPDRHRPGRPDRRLPAAGCDLPGIRPTVFGQAERV